MTLIEALKSGSRFKREGECVWHRTGPWTEDEVLAGDWGLESLSVTITRETLAAAWEEAFDGPQEKALVKLCWLLRL